MKQHPLRDGGQENIGWKSHESQRGTAHTFYFEAEQHEPLFIRLLIRRAEHVEPLSDLKVEQRTLESSIHHNA